MYCYRSKIVIDDPPKNPYDLHRMVYGCFPSPIQDDERILYSLIGGALLVIQSIYQPDITRTTGFYTTCDKVPVLPQSNLLRFEVTANPTVKRSGRRRALLHKDEQIAWISRKLAGGASAENFRITDNGPVVCYKGSRRITHSSVTFRGIIRIDDRSAFERIVVDGFGPAKGFGFGLIHLKEI